MGIVTAVPDRWPSRTQKWSSIRSDDAFTMEYMYDKSKPKAQIAQSFRRIERPSRLIAPSQVAIDRSHEAIRSSNARLVSPTHEPERDVCIGTVQAFLSGGDGAAMGAILEELFPAYLEAAATGDDETADTLRKALLILGRHLARALGPKLAGAAIN